MKRCLSIVFCIVASSWAAGCGDPAFEADKLALEQRGYSVEELAELATTNDSGGTPLKIIGTTFGDPVAAAGTCGGSTSISTAINNCNKDLKDSGGCQSYYTCTQNEQGEWWCNCNDGQEEPEWSPGSFKISRDDSEGRREP